MNYNPIQTSGVDSRINLGLCVLMPTPTPAAQHPGMHLPDMVLPFTYLSPPSSTHYAKPQNPNKGSTQAFPSVSTPRRPCNTTNAYKAYLLMSSGLDYPPKNCSQRKNCQSLVNSKMQVQSVFSITSFLSKLHKLSTAWKAR